MGSLGSDGSSLGERTAAAAASSDFWPNPPARIRKPHPAGHHRPAAGYRLSLADSLTCRTDTIVPPRERSYFSGGGTGSLAA